VRRNDLDGLRVCSQWNGLEGVWLSAEQLLRLILLDRWRLPSEGRLGHEDQVARFAGVARSCLTSGRPASHGVALILMRVADALPRMGQPLRRKPEFALESKRRQKAEIDVPLAVGIHLGHCGATAPRL
jgi:hypothetical protein